MFNKFRPIITLLYDGMSAGIMLLLSLLIAFEGIPQQSGQQSLFWLAPAYALITITVFFVFSQHRTVWRYTSLRDLVKLLQAVVLSVAMAMALLFLATRLEHFPRSAFIILLFLHLCTAIGPRFLVRLAREYFNSSWGKDCSNQRSKNTLIIGANDASSMFLQELGRSSLGNKYNILGLLDSEPRKAGRIMHGAKVLGTPQELNQTLTKLNKSSKKTELLILAEQQLDNLSEILAIARSHKINVKRLPSLASLEAGESLSSLKPVSIEDLLGRPARKLNMQPIEKMVKGKRVMVTGAGGSIGSELCRQICALNPAELIMADHSEHNLYTIDLELKSSQFAKIPKKDILLDVRNQRDVEAILKNNQVDVIFHAAAYKHVPTVEANPISGIETNLFGTKTVADAADKFKVSTMVIISTDKAVNPTNVMGATKRAAEIYCQNHPSENTRFITVRFGNVLGSNGSVIPLFQKQIYAGGPITVTSKKAERYFMTIPEAVMLTMRAAALGVEEDTKGEVFMLDMGKPVKIWDMAEEMVKLSGLTPGIDIEIKETGLRPGEKIKEELWYDGESMQQTQVNEVFRVKPWPIQWKDVNKNLQAMYKSCEIQNKQQAVDILKQFVPEYSPANNSPYKKG